jgi:hypothetical protein
VRLTEGLWGGDQIEVMVLFGTILIRVLVGMFLLGMVGSAVVILISFVEDFRELLSHD